MRPVVSLLSAAIVFSACSGSGSSISDAEVDAIKTTRASLVTADEFSTPGVLHVRLAWGFLAFAGKGQRPQGVDWTGGLTASTGAARLDMTTFFEKGDAPVEGTAENVVQWSSHTSPHFDGVIVTLTPGSADATVQVDTPLFKKSFSAAELVAGLETRATVDEAGHEFSVSAIPDEDASCSGFVVGFTRADGDVQSFKGLRLSNVGDRLGKLRFEVQGGAITADVLDLNGELVESGVGTLDTATRTFSVSLARSTITGQYVDPSYSSRGSFQASVRCN